MLRILRVAPTGLMLASVAAATERTVVRFLSAPDGLWIGVHACDREPSRILHAQLRRDTDVGTDDAVLVLLSPLQDKRTAFELAVNPVEACDLFEGTTVVPGTYWFDRWEVQYEGSRRRAVFVDAHANYGKYYHGDGEDYALSIGGRWQPHPLRSLDFGFTEARFPASRFVARTMTTRVDYALTPRLNTTRFARWNNDANRGAVTARLRWTRTPGPISMWC